MKKWKCKKCGKEKDVEHHENHEIKESKAECLNCGEKVDAPLCCNKKMYIAS
jgi:DNA-directed RNA polymerase subunit RPC12/RpoP